MVRIFWVLVMFFGGGVSFGQTFFTPQKIDYKQKQAHCLPYSTENLEVLQKEKMRVKKVTKNWIFFSASQQEIEAVQNTSIFKQLYKEFAPPSLMADSARALHLVDSVHSGTGGLPSSYTGEGVIVGYVDTGIDFNHPDFKNSDGTTRVLRYWDHSFNQGSNPYGYGAVWTNADINAGNCTSMDNSGHGTTVAGQGSGGGHLGGYNKGMAPNSKIIIVESNFSLPNWTLTIADACDYIFKVADSLGMPAVVNISLGTYHGSHDGNDPASELIETLLDEKEGRIVVSSAGNSGNSGKYHVQNQITADTSFTWMIPNPTGQLGANTTFIDLWTDVSDTNFQFAFGADRVTPDYSFRGRTAFRGASSFLGSSYQDTIWNGSNRIATIVVESFLVNQSLNLRAVVTADSTNFRYRFETFGGGKYDLWSGAFIGLSDFETNIPSVATFSPIANYVMPDSLQTIVSSWNCSEKVISVANIKNRLSYLNGNNVVYNSPETTPRGMLSPTSSKGPNRLGTVKPDIGGAGDISMGSAPLSVWGATWIYHKMDSSRKYIRNGGTSMASPAVAGVAALYLEKCPKANYLDFKNDLTATAQTSPFMGTLPNYGYGYGTANALSLLLQTNFDATVTGASGICDSAVELSLTSLSVLDSVIWNTNDTTISIYTDTIGGYFAEVFNENGCRTDSDTLTLVQFSVPTISPITESGNHLSVTSSESVFQWTMNGTDITGETDDNYTISSGGNYSVYVVNSDGCYAFADTISSSLSIGVIDNERLIITPNPTQDFFSVESTIEVVDVYAIDFNGKEIKLERINNQFSLKNLAKGTYVLRIESKEKQFFSRLVKL